MLDQRLRRWPNINPTLVLCLVFTGMRSSWRLPTECHTVSLQCGSMRNKGTGCRDIIYNKTTTTHHHIKLTLWLALIALYKAIKISYFIARAVSTYNMLMIESRPKNEIILFIHYHDYTPQTLFNIILMIFYLL